MSKPPQYWNKSKKFLSKKDKVMRSLIKKYSDTNLTTRKDVFFSICKSIVGQQISVAAANSVFLKFKKACGGKITPKAVKNLSIIKLKRCGLSRQKVIGIKDLSKKFLDKTFNPNLIRELIYPVGVFEITVSRSGSFLFIKLFVGTFLAYIMSLFAFTIKKRNFASRIDVSIGALFIAIGNKFFAESESVRLLDCISEIFC